MSFPSPQQANNASLWIGNFDNYLDFFNRMKIELISQNTISVDYLKSVGLMNIFSISIIIISTHRRINKFQTINYINILRT